MADELPQNFVATSGERVVIKITVMEDGVPVPIATAQEIVWKLGRTARSAPAVSKSLGQGIFIITDQAGAGEANAGRVDVTLGPQETAALDGEYYCDCFMTAANGIITRIYFGRAFFAPRLI